MIKTAQELSLDWSSVKSLRIPKAEKIPKVKAIRGGVSDIERAAIADLSFPFYEVKKARELLIHLDDWLRSAGVDVTRI